MPEHRTTQMHPLIILGRFPPPSDGQSLSTERFASMMSGHFEVHRIDTGMEEGTPVAIKIRTYFSAGMALRRLTRLFPDAVVAWQSISPTAMGHLRDRLTVYPFAGRARIVAINHRRFFPVFVSSATSRSAIRMIDRLRRVVFLDQTLAEECRQWIPENKIVTIANSVDDATLCSEAEFNQKAARVRNGPLRILYLSNMLPEKGYLTVVRAAALLRERNVDFQVEFAGAWVADGHEEEFHSLVKSLGVADRITHHGTVRDRDRVKQLHLDADIFVLPTYLPHEAQPVSIIEALSAGAAVVSTRQGGIPEMVDDGKEASLIRARDPEALADAVMWLSDDSRRKTRVKAGRQRFNRDFHPSVIEKKWVDLITGIISEID